MYECEKCFITSRPDCKRKKTFHLFMPYVNNQGHSRDQPVQIPTPGRYVPGQSANLSRVFPTFLRSGPGAC